MIQGDKEMDAIILLKEKLTEAEADLKRCDDRLGKLARDTKSMQAKKEEVVDTIKALKKSIGELKALGKGKSKKDKS